MRRIPTTKPFFPLLLLPMLWAGPSLPAQPAPPAATAPTPAATPAAAPPPAAAGLRLSLSLPAHSEKGRLELRPYPSARDTARRFLTGEEPAPAQSLELAAAQPTAGLEAPFGFWLLSYHGAGGQRLDLPLTPLETARDLGLPADAAGPWELRVVDAQGAPIAGARVALRSAGLLRPSWQAAAVGLATDAGGRVVLPRPAPRGELWVLAPGYRPLAATYLREELPGQVRLASQPSAAIQVVGQRRQPLAGALVSSPAGVPLGFTGAGGELAGPFADGDVVFVEDGQGHRWRETVDLQQGRKLRVQVTRPSAHGGEVVDRRGGGRPIPGALVWIAGRPETWRAADGKGLFEIYDRLDERSTRLEIEAQAPNFSRASAAAADGVVLALERADRLLTGRVTDEFGEPLEGALIVAANRDESASWSARSDEEGEYRLAGLPAGQLWAEVSKEAYLMAKQPIDRSFGEVRLDFRLSPGLRVVGQVVSADAAPLGTVSVLLAGLSASEPPQPLGAGDGEGNFSVGPFDPGSYRLILQAPGRVRRELPVELTAELAAAGEPLDLGVIELEAEEAWAGRVVDEEGEPLAGAAVFVWRNEDERGMLLEWPTWRTPDATSGADGGFSLAGLSGGETIALEIRLEGRPPFFARNIAIGPGAASDFVVPLGGTLEVEVLDARRDPVPNAQVTLLRHGADKFENWQATGLDGKVAYPALAAGPFELRVESRNYGVYRQNLELAAGESPTVQVVLGEQGSTLDGRVRYPDGQPAVGLKVYLDTGEKVSPPAVSARVDESGYYHLEGLPDGTFKLEVSRREGYSPLYSRRVTLDLAQNQVDIDLPDSSVRELEVLVVAEDGTPLEGVGVSIYYKQRRGGIVSLSLRTDGEGIALFGEVPQATYEIMAWAPDPSWRSGEARVRLDAPRREVRVMLARNPEAPIE